MNVSLELGTTKTIKAVLHVGCKLISLKHYVLVVVFTDIVADVASRVTLMD